MLDLLEDLEDLAIGATIWTSTIMFRAADRFTNWCFGYLPNDEEPGGYQHILTLLERASIFGKQS